MARRRRILAVRLALVALLSVQPRLAAAGKSSEPAAAPAVTTDLRAVPDAARNDAVDNALDDTPDHAAGSLPGDARVGTVTIFVGDIFDPSEPGEGRKVFRLANRLHRSTRDWVIRQQLLFEPGDPYSPRLLEESERILRKNRYLHDAEILPVAVADGRVDVDVRTRDVWTMTGGVHFARSGGENETEFEIQDFNFLGTGKEIGISRSSDFERTSSELLYRDFNLARTRGQIEVKLGENSDGYRRLLHLRRPFFALDTRWAAGLTALTEDRVDPLFALGEVSGEFRHRIDVFEGWWGFSRGLVGSTTRRWKLGFSYLSDRFSPAPDRTPPDTLPPDRTLSFPWIDLEIVQDRFIEARDLDKIARTEDLHLGRRFQARLGWSSPVWGGDRDLAVFGSTAELGLKPGTRKLLLLSSNAGARWGSRGFETFVTGGSVRFFWRNLRNHLFFASLSVALVEDLDPEHQLTLGGDNGLRGYPLRFQEGDRRFLLTVEQRLFSNRQLFKLANVGAAAFFDVGRAWFVGSNGEDDLGILKDVGIGLRLSPNRSGRGTMVHLDLAFPLDADGSIDSVQWLVTTKESF